MTRPQQTRRGPAASNIAILIALVAVLAAVALTASQPAPPAIAQFAPQAQHQIKQAPLQQTGDNGDGKGSGTRPGGTPSPTAKPTPPKPGEFIDAPSVLPCYGNPPRQLSFDSQSPPCIAYWKGENGGATSRGVTANQITVVVTGNFGSQDDPAAKRIVADLQNFYNRNFMFYGRQVKFTYLNGNAIASNTSNGPHCQFEYSAARDISQRYRPFAITDPNANAPGCFLIGSARQGVIATSEYAWLTEKEMRQYAPYLWQYPMGIDQELTATGQYVCTQLAGGTADHANDPLLHGKKRKYGVMFHYGFSVSDMDLSPLRQEMAKCGTTIDVVSKTGFRGGEGNDKAVPRIEQETQSGILAMRQAGVTDVICLCNIILSALVSSAADTQSYHPEWVLSSVGGQDFNFYESKFWAPDQRGSMMGLTFYPDQVPYPTMTLNQALASVDPGFQVDGPWTLMLPAQALYWQTLMIASGIQMAGPHLTPQSFSTALQKTTFPNPTFPQQEGRVGFENNTHGFTKDTALFWWSEAAAGPHSDTPNGAWCYTGLGRRYDPFRLPKGQPLFTGRCTATP
ncbi:MAG: hypothetical protein JWM40_2853 [Frankiales bacterium]|nr:hypothetical protein [Frankiales bacterium]